MYPAALTETAARPAEPAESPDTLKLCPHEEFLKVCKKRAGEVLCSIREIETEGPMLPLNMQLAKALSAEWWGGDSALSKEDTVQPYPEANFLSTP